MQPWKIQNNIHTKTITQVTRQLVGTLRWVGSWLPRQLLLNHSQWLSRRLPRLSRLLRLLRPHKQSLLILLLTFGLYFVVLFSQMIVAKPDGIYIGHDNVWGDWALHTSMAHIFAYKAPSDWLAYHPIYAGGKFTYGWLTNFISGMLIRAGLPLTASFILPSISFVLLLLVGMYFVFYLLSKNQKASLLAICLFFFSSGLGVVQHLQNWWQQPSFQSFFYSSKDVTRILEYRWLAGNIVSGILVSQRAFLLGMTLAVWVLVGVLVALRRDPQNAKKTAARIRSQNRLLFSAAGLLAGILPIAHMHSLMTLVIISGALCFAHWRRFSEWIWYVLTAGVVSSFFFFLFVNGGIENPEFMGLLVGWSVGPNLVAWLIMWWHIWGMTLPAALVSLFLWRTYSYFIRIWTISFWGLFILANIVRFQPIVWDNSKLFAWVYFGLSLPIALLLQHLWHQRGAWWPKQIGLRILTTALFLSLTLTGMFQLLHMQQFKQHTYQMATLNDMRLGEWLRNNTGPREVFLTNTAHDHPVSVWGVRPILLGYPTWAFNFGFAFRQREQDLKRMFAGDPATPKLLQQYGISYVVIGANELRDQNANEVYFREQYPLLLDAYGFRIYDVRD